MLKEARFSKILEVVNERKYASLKALSLETGCSESTIRADIIELDKLGKLLRLRGGAQALNDESLSYELSIEEKMNLQMAEKKAIAKYAVSLIEPRSMVYLDAGTTTYYLAEELDDPSVTVITNSVLIARKVSSKGIRAYVIGGELKLSTDAFIGPMAIESLGRFRFDIGFFGTNGIDLKQGFTTPDVEEATIKSKAIAQCTRYYVVADSSKFDAVTAVSFAPFEGKAILTDLVKLDSYKDKGILEAQA